MFWNNTHFFEHCKSKFSKVASVISEVVQLRYPERTCRIIGLRRHKHSSLTLKNYWNLSELVWARELVRENLHKMKVWGLIFVRWKIMCWNLNINVVLYQKVCKTVAFYDTTQMHTKLVHNQVHYKLFLTYK